MQALIDAEACTWIPPLQLCLPKYLVPFVPVPGASLNASAAAAQGNSSQAAAWLSAYLGGFQLPDVVGGALARQLVGVADKVGLGEDSYGAVDDRTVTAVLFLDAS